MSTIRKIIGAALALVSILVVAGPVLALAGLLLAGVVLFALAVTIWAFVLLGERWIDEGLRGYGYLEALDDSLNDVFHGIRRALSAATWRRHRDAILGALPILFARLRVIGSAVLVFLILPIAVLVEGFRVVRTDLRSLVPTIRSEWRYAAF